MKSLVYILVIICLQSCLTIVEKKKVLSYKLNDSTKIEINYVSGGATASDYLKVIKENLLSNENTTIKILEGYSDNFVFHINEYNDSIFILNLIDTSKFTTTNRDQNFRININQTDTTLNKYK